MRSLKKVRLFTMGIAFASIGCSNAPSGVQMNPDASSGAEGESEGESEAAGTVICEDANYSGEQFTAAFNAAVAALAAEGYEVVPLTWEDEEGFSRLVQGMVEALDCTPEHGTGEELADGSSRRNGSGACQAIFDFSQYRSAVMYCGPGARLARRDNACPWYYQFPGDCLNRLCYEHDRCYESLIQAQGPVCLWSNETSSCDNPFHAAALLCSPASSAIGQEGFWRGLIESIAGGIDLIQDVADIEHLPICLYGTSCPNGKADCDGNSLTRCEIDVRTDAQHCGDCDTVCDAIPAGDCIDDITRRTYGAVQCQNGRCAYSPTRVSCDDNDPCTADRCSAGSCEFESLVSSEVCDGVDNDCDGEVDEGCGTNGGVPDAGAENAFDAGLDLTGLGFDASSGGTPDAGADVGSGGGVVCPEGCDDSDACTVDTCVADNDCRHVAVELPPDNDVCTGTECNPATGAFGPPEDVAVAIDGDAITGSNDGVPDQQDSTCGLLGSDPSSEVVYSLVAPQDDTLQLSLVGATFDTVLSVRTNCHASDTQFACNDDFVGLQSALVFDVTAGAIYYVIVEGWSAADVGDFTLTISHPACGDGLCLDEDADTCAADCGCAAVSSCDAFFPAPGGCFCDSICLSLGDCCPDYCALCGVELCDDGAPCTTDICDAVASTCINDAAGEHIVLSEVTVTPDEAEAIELYNPTGDPVDVGGWALADFATYYAPTGAEGSSDFAVAFPAGTLIDACGYLTVAVKGAGDFGTANPGVTPDLEILGGLTPDDATVPNMLGGLGRESTRSRSLTNESELVVLYQLVGVGGTPVDVDYVRWGDPATEAIDKTGVPGYAAETVAASQSSLGATHAAGGSYHRCDIGETGEIITGGNGIGGHDETSEPWATTWHTAAASTPGAADATCP